MRAPRSVLQHRVTIEPYRGTSGTAAPIYGNPITGVPALLTARRKVIRTGDDTVVVCTAMAIVGGDLDVPELSRVTVTKGTGRFAGKKFLTHAVEEGVGLYGTVLQQLTLEGPK